jgi:uncharacterized protein YndB with AHSA1/START domain
MAALGYRPRVVFLQEGSVLKKLGLALLAIVVVLAIVIATRPAHFSVSRSAAIHAPADAIYAYITDFHKFPQWSPWQKLDPGMTTSFGGSASGVGSTYSWKGTDKVGEGMMTITEVKPPEYVGMDLDFIAPMKMKNRTEFKLQPGVGDTTVTWAMSGDNGFVGKAFGMVMDLDKEVGKDFEGGLSQLKTLTEADAKKRAEAAMVAAKAAMPPPTAAPASAPASAPAPMAAAPAHKPAK